MAFSGHFQTTELGTVEVDQQRVLTFPKGIPGFEHCHHWHLFHEEKNNPVVFWLQSLDDPEVMLNVIDPAVLDVGYRISLTETERHELDARPDAPLAALLILSRSGPEQRIKALTHAPIIINLQTQRGLQKIGVQCHILSSNTQIASKATPEAELAHAESATIIYPNL